jgi:hypothetical protein
VKEGPVEHVTLTGDRSGEYVLIEERTDRSLVVAPDTSIQAIRRRAGTRPMTSAEFQQHLGNFPSDREG